MKTKINLTQKIILFIGFVAILILIALSGCTKPQLNCYVCTLRPGVEMTVCDVTEDQLRALVGDCPCLKYQQP